MQDALVPKENVLGEIGRGHIIAFNILNIGRYKLGVGVVGSSKRGLEISAQYANQRQQFKQPIARFSAYSGKSLRTWLRKFMQQKAQCTVRLVCLRRVQVS
ncbi:hypothetical protein GCM10020331_028250 [Ectobacillus funiculus]